MSLKARLRPTYKAIQTYRSTLGASKKPILTVYGNCQSGALATMLRNSPTFSAKFRVAWVSGAHEITHGELPAFRRLLSRTSVLVTQNIRENYREMPLGTDDVREALPQGAGVLTFSSMYFRGLHPYLAYVHATGELGTPAPLTEGYHDLRFIGAASRGLQGEAALDWVSAFSGRKGWICDTASKSLAELRRREEDIDVKISDGIEGEGAFWTLNHPSNSVLSLAAEQIHDAFDLPYSNWNGHELLGSTVAPVGRDVREALDLPHLKGDPVWTVEGKAVAEAEILAAHLDFYREHPEVLDCAVQEHAAALIASGLLVE